jgi:hypothetical protein
MALLEVMKAILGTRETHENRRPPDAVVETRMPATCALG